VRRISVALALARRGLRGSRSHVVLVTLALALAVAVMTAVSVAGRSVLESARENARALLGGDLVLETTGLPLSEAELRALLPPGSHVATVANLHTFARLEDRRVTVSLEGVDRSWPLFGEVILEPPGGVGAILARGGAVAEHALFLRLGGGPGARVSIGTLEDVELAAVLRRQPDRLAGGLALGPRVVIALDRLRESGLLAPGSFVRWRHAVALPAGADPLRVAAELRVREEGQRFRVRTAEELLPRIALITNRIATFLSLAALALFAVGTLAVLLVGRAHALRRRGEVAVMRALGAELALLAPVLAFEVALLLLPAVALGLAAGLVLVAVPAALLGHLLPFPLSLHVAASDLLVPALVGLLAAGAVLLPAVAAIARTPPAVLFRPTAGVRKAGPVALALSVLLLAAALAVVALRLPEPRLSAVAVSAPPVAFALFLLAARAVRQGAAWLLPRVSNPRLRPVLRGLAAPGGGPAAVVVAVGFTVALAGAVGGVEGRLRAELLEGLPERAASLFLVDIQPDQRPQLQALVHAHRGTLLQEAPVVRARVVEIAGMPVERRSVDPGVSWTIQADRALTWMERPPPETRLVAGSWWPADWRGEPLVSIEERVARGYGVWVGDTLGFNVLGRRMTARIANVREHIDWSRGRIDFVFVLSPGVLEGAPHTFIAAADFAPEDEAAFLLALSRELPNVTAAPMSEVVAQIRGLFDGAAAVLRILALAVAGATVLVLLASWLLSERARRRELAVLRAVGATKAEIRRLWLLEFAALGTAAALMGALAGTALAAAVLGGVLHLAPFPPALSVLLPALIAPLAVAAAGSLAVARTLRRPPARLLGGT